MFDMVMTGKIICSGILTLEIHTLRFESALCEWISNVSLPTGTSWDVIPHITLGIDATNSRTRVNTVQPLTGLV